MTWKAGNEIDFMKIDVIGFLRSAKWISVYGLGFGTMVVVRVKDFKLTGENAETVPFEGDFRTPHQTP